MENLALQEIGFTKSESSVYLALLQLGPSTTGPIIKKAGISSGKIYHILDKLIKKGVVSYITRGKTKYFHAKNPQTILDYFKVKQEELASKESELARLMPQLKARYLETKNLPRAEIFDGNKGFKTVMLQILEELKSGDVMQVMGVPIEANKKFEGFLLDWNKKRIAKRIKLEIIYNNAGRTFGDLRKKMTLTKVKYMKPELESPTYMDIFNDNILLIDLQSNPICFLIRDPLIAQTYKRHFEHIWNESFS